MPVEAPLGTAARKRWSFVMRSTSTVGFPRESKISRALMLWITAGGGMTPSTCAMWHARSTNRFEYPHSLSYHDTSFTNLSFKAMQAVLSKMEESGQVTKSVDTTSASVKPRMPFIGPSAALLIAAVMASILPGLSRRHVKSTTETSGVGTRNAMPVNFPFSAGMTLPTALAAPVEEGMMFSEAHLPPRQSLPPREGPSTVS
mmetsp:Transcript_23524/g.44364  ORF Transcript_23524/g.44364 Transcript_23524/m.44364 type:complete len:202 (-) Transcript_23524:632-1237(-)